MKNKELKKILGKKKKEYELKETLSIFLSDLIESLNKRNLFYRIIDKDSDEEKKLNEWVENNFPFESFGKINWQKVKSSKCYSWYEWEEMCSTLSVITKELNENPTSSVFLVWADVSLPLFEINFESLKSVGGAIMDTDFDVWFICPSKSWCIEKYHEGSLCYGWSGGVTHQ